jgi:hypothetical protein
MYFPSFQLQADLSHRGFDLQLEVARKHRKRRMMYARTRSLPLAVGLA